MDYVVLIYLSSTAHLQIYFSIFRINQHQSYTRRHALKVSTSRIRWDTYSVIHMQSGVVSAIVFNDTKQKVSSMIYKIASVPESFFIHWNTFWNGSSFDTYAQIMQEPFQKRGINQVTRSMFEKAVIHRDSHFQAKVFDLPFQTLVLCALCGSIYADSMRRNFSAEARVHESIQFKWNIVMLSIWKV